MTTPSYTYIPSRDELVLILRPVRGRPSKQLNHLKIWFDEHANIKAITVGSYSRLQREFNQNLRTVKLEGMWKGITITREDIEWTRKQLLAKLEGRW